MAVTKVRAEKLKYPSGALSTLVVSALALPQLRPLSEALAESVPEAPSVKLRYYSYEDWQDSGVDRMDIKSPMLWVESPLGESTKVEGAFLIDDMSGASPWYLDAVSGASGIGIEDQRNAADVRVTRLLGDYSVSLGGAYSSEDDYISRAGSIEGSWSSSDRNTTLTAGFSPSFDRITSSNNSDLLERRRTFHYLLGITQVLTPNAVMLANVTYSNGDGYHSDQYKYFDKRPESRDQYAALIRHNQYFPSLDAALHSDYRYYVDSWGLDSHTMELKWYQPLGERWMVRPSIRYYSQSDAEFFSTEFPPVTEEFGFLSYDQRMSAFGSLGAGIKVTVDVGYGFSIDFLAEMFEQRSSWKLGGGGSSNISPFIGRVLGVGIGKQF